MSNRTQFELNYLRDSALIIYVNLQLLFLTVYLNHFELENGVMTTPKRRSILPALIFKAYIEWNKMYGSRKPFPLSKCGQAAYLGKLEVVRYDC